ncbi:DUF3800 domain-containing protein [Sphingobacterium multivorum]|uniref:DUF3800 domain-containing protein n=1 Tax=Sphingobacterium multivorum TaxID=28454 RepID=UPI003DA68F26
MKIKNHTKNKTTETIYIDESGNTGQDLLNKDQLAFVLASNNFSENELSTLTGLFPEANELHFVKLKGSEAGRKAIIEFLNHPLITEDHVQCFTTHKEYAAVGQLVDRLIEPVYYDIGVDIYERGMNISLVNFIYHFGVGNIWDKQLFEKFLSAFMVMMRTKTLESIDTFYFLAQELHDSSKTREKGLIVPILKSKNQIDEILSHVDKFALDVTLSGFYVICDLWYKRVRKKLSIFHDSSKQIDHYREHIEFTSNLQMETQEIGFDSRTMTYPTQIESLEMNSSENIKGIQVSDLIASSIAFMYNNKNAKHLKFVEQIQNSRLLNLSNYFTVWPNQLVTSKDLGMNKGEGQNPLDFLAALMYEKGKQDKI